MSLENDIFKKSAADFVKLKKYGFKACKAGLKFEKLFHDGEFKAIIIVNADGEIKGKVIDVENDEEYLLLRIESSKSSFAGTIRAEYEEILKDIRGKCTFSKLFVFPQSNRIAEIIAKRYKCGADFPFSDYSHGVFRNPFNDKWFGLIMNIDKSKLNKSAKGEIEIINLKPEKIQIPLLLQKNGIYPAYHMNKNCWISVALDNRLSDEEIVKLLDVSYSFTENKKNKRFIPGKSGIIMKNTKRIKE